MNESAVMDYPETISKRVLEAMTPGATLEYRQSQSHGEYDFDFHRQDGTIAAVEVTAAVDEALMKALGAIRGRRAGGRVMRATVCKKSWVIFPSKIAAISKIRADADRCLARLEQEGIDNFFCVSNFRSVQEICCQLQITGGGDVSSEGKATIRIGSPIGGGAVGASDAIEAAETPNHESSSKMR